MGPVHPFVAARSGQGARCDGLSRYPVPSMLPSAWLMRPAHPREISEFERYKKQDFDRWRSTVKVSHHTQKQVE